MLKKPVIPDKILLAKPETVGLSVFGRRDFAKLTLGALGVVAVGEKSRTVGAKAAQRANHQETPEVRYGIGPCWSPRLGDVRAIVAVTNQRGAVRAHIPWRRRDQAPQDKEVIILDAKTRRKIKNVAGIQINRAFGDIVFQPATVPGKYEVYYMPYTVTPIPWAYTVTYPPPESSADPAWMTQYGLTPKLLTSGRWKALPRAEVLQIEARRGFDRFDPMEVIATELERRDLLARHPDQSYLLFPEERQFPIRMTEDLPLYWIEHGPSTEFRGEARLGEFYVFQVGVYAGRTGIGNLVADFSDLRSEQGAVIPRAAMRCFNLSGTDWDGCPIRKTFSVPQGTVRALWFGVQVPKDAPPGSYQGSLTLSLESKEESRLRLHLEVSAQPVEEAGDNDLWRLSRLRWLDSTIAIDDEVTAPYTPLKLQGQQVSCLGREVQFGNAGFPQSIRSNGIEILAGPISMVVETPERKVQWQSRETRILKKSAGVMIWESSGTDQQFALRCATKMEFDGYISFKVSLRALQASHVDDVRLEVPIRRGVAVYMMGLGRKGGYRPQEWKWKWDINRANNSVWIGDYNAGLQVQLQTPQETGVNYDLKATGIPESWGNGGKGGCTVTEEGDRVMLRAYSGPRTLATGTELTFNFSLLGTPVKPLDPAHWKQRYYQQGYPEPGAVPVDFLLDAGVTIVNIHQGNELNPYINYPFLTVDRLSAYVNEVHAVGLKAKIYYTVRELSNRAVELWALRSLGYEVYVDGPGGGGAWLREHLVSHYKPAWHQTLATGEVDEAIEQRGLSRWDNYYLEGLAYLLKHAEIDGLYLDGIAYNREVMKRVRKVLDRNRPGCLIDFHSGNNFTFHDLRISPANQYMDHFPYINSLWLGEMYNYNESPDYWLVEISGIPFGLFSEMLQGGGNPWRGMIYGMTARYSEDPNAKHIWHLWDGFGIQDAEMIGYWVPSCPVKTTQKNVLATVYKKTGKALISIASWAKEPVTCPLSIDWTALQLKPESATLFAPAIEGFQEKASFSPSAEIPIEPGRGWLLILEEHRH